MVENMKSMSACGQFNSIQLCTPQGRCPMESHVCQPAKCNMITGPSAKFTVLLACRALKVSRDPYCWGKEAIKAHEKSYRM